MTSRRFVSLAIALALTGLSAGCASQAARKDARAASARYALNRVSRSYAVPARDAENIEARNRLLRQAVDGYMEVFERYRDVPAVAAQALRHLGDTYLAQDDFPAAMACYDRAVREFPGEDWEVIQCLKAMGDLLWDRGLRDEAVPHYRDIVQRYGSGEHPEMFATLVSIARGRLSEAARR